MSADEFNESEIAAGKIKPAHVSELTARFQKEQGIPVDGKLGPATRAVLELLRGRITGPTPIDPPLVPSRETIPGLPALDVRKGWLVGDRVTAMPIHPSWYYPALATADRCPAAIVAHYTSTDPGTAIVMAKHRAKPLAPGDRAASWHVSIEADGSIIQMAPFTAGCWHAGGKTAKPIQGLGPANHFAVGLELVGHGDKWPAPQVAAASRVWRALARAYSIPRGYAMVTHQELDPTRKSDPGELWMSFYAPGVLDYAYMGV